MKKLSRLLKLIIISWCLNASNCLGQADGIFGNDAASPPSTGFGEGLTTNTSALTNAQLPEDKHVVVRSLRRNPPRSTVEISRAILYMTRIERWDEIARYLDQLAKLPIDEATALKMTRAAGLDTWFKLSGQAGKLKEEQLATARKVLDLSSGAVRNPATLLNAIELLNATELVDRKRGVLAIQASGETGLAAMLESIASSDKPPAPIMSEAIITLGAEGEAALKAAICTTDGKARERLSVVAARIPGGAYIAELTTSLYTLPPESDAYRQVSKALSPAGQALPQALASQRYVLDQMESQLHEFKKFRRESTSSIQSVWRWSPDGKRLITEFDDSAGLHLERAYQLAFLATQLAPHSSIDSALATAVIFERQYRLSPVIDLDPAAFQEAFRPRAQIDNLDYLGLVWDTSRKAELRVAQLRTVQAIGLALKQNPPDSSASIRRLSEAVKDSAPAVRYTAALALSQGPSSDRSFEGRYAYDQTKLEMQRLESKPLALVIGGSIELRDSLSGHLSLLGIRTLSAKSARETMRLIQEPQPIEYVFVVDRVLEMSLSELVQRLRSHTRTAAVPLAVLTDQFGTTQRALVVDEGFPLIHYSSLTTNLDLTSVLLNEMQVSSPIPKMDSVDRMTFRSFFEPVAEK